MKRRIFAVAVLVSLLSGAVTVHATTFPYASIRALQMVAVYEDGSAKLLNICTAFSIGEKLWMTKAHCLEGEWTVYIDGEPILHKIVDPLHDLAIFRTQVANAPALKIATVAPEAGDDIVMLGHPLGIYATVPTFGRVSIPEWREPGFEFPYMLIQLVGAPGNSGSPILNSRMEVVSVLEWGWGRSFEPMTVGSAHSVVLGFLRAAGVILAR